jgi:hypothetical protein
MLRLLQHFRGISCSADYQVPPPLPQRADDPPVLR